MAQIGRSGSAAAALLALAAMPANSAEFCVTCEGPQAQYACTIDGASASSNDPRLKFLCMTELAKAGGHASCAIDRAQQEKCTGVPKVLKAPDGLDAAAPPAPASPATTLPDPKAAAGDSSVARPATPLPGSTGTTPSAQPSGPQETAVAKTTGPPATVKEMVDKGAASAGQQIGKTGEATSAAAKSAGTALDNAGKAVGNAAKKTWTCVTSLFSDC